MSIEIKRIEKKFLAMLTIIASPSKVTTNSFSDQTLLPHFKERVFLTLARISLIHFFPTFCAFLANLIFS